MCAWFYCVLWFFPHFKVTWANGAYIYIQLGGTLQANCLIIEDPNLYMIATSSSVASIYMPTGSTNITFKMTYYTTGNNSWYSGANSWKCEQLSSNLIPLKNNIMMYSIYTKGFNGITAQLALPTSLTYGCQILLKDAGSFANISNIQINSTNSNLIEQSSSDTINTSRGYKRYAYIGGGSSGLLLSI